MRGPDRDVVPVKLPGEARPFLGADLAVFLDFEDEIEVLFGEFTFQKCPKEGSAV